MTAGASGSVGALAAFLRLSRREGESIVALRALTLHMLAGLAPRFFAEHRLGRVFAASLEAVRALPATLGEDVAPDVMMARLDALYVRSLHGDRLRLPSASVLAKRFTPIHAQSPLYAWLLARLAAKLGRATPFAELTMASCCLTPVEELCFATHQLLLDGDYCMRPIDPARFVAQATLMESRARFVVARGELDVGAEMAFCLTMLGRRRAARPLVRWLRAHQRSDGAVVEAASDRFDALHTTAAALLAFASDREPARPSSNLTRRRSGNGRGAGRRTAR